MARASKLPVGTVEVGLRHQGRERPYLLRAPAEPHAPAALLLELHGRGIGPIPFDGWTGFSALADEEGFVLAMPSAIGEVWNDGRYLGRDWPEHEAIDDVGYLLAVIDDVAARQAIDPARVYVVGMSNGATMAGRLAWERAERLAGVAQVAGTIAARVAAAVAAPQVPGGPLPLLEMHGTRDRSVPYDGGRAALWTRLFVRRRGGPVLSVDAWARRWVEHNGAAEEPLVEQVAQDVAVRRWRGPSDASDLAFYRVEGGGHTWPGARVWMPPHLGHVTRSIDATRVIWAFLSAHRRAGLGGIDARPAADPSGPEAAIPLAATERLPCAPMTGASSRAGSPPDAAARRRVRRTAFGLLVGLLVQFLAGMWVNLFVTIPAAHPGSQPPEYFAGSATSVAWAISSSGLPALVFHATWGLVLVLGSLALVASARRLRRRGITVAAVAAFLCVLGAGFNGASFLDFDENFSSMLMASLFALAVLADLVILNALAAD